MMNPRVPTATATADLLALAEVLGSPAGKRETLALIAEQLAAVQAAALDAHTKYAEMAAASRALAVAQADLALREAALEERRATVADSHNGIAKRQTEVSSKEVELGRATAEFDDEVRGTRAELDKRERAVKELSERAAGMSADARAVKTDYENRIAKLKAIAGG
ncbi:MAG TPA: hypothetical protein VJ396_09350 [Acidiferrobacterales bacterium]|nr:hypothetical protein [Acidiferrobacterales bacterium]